MLSQVKQDRVSQDKLPPTYLPQLFLGGIYLISQNDQSNGPYFSNKKNLHIHNGHVKINLSKMIQWYFLCMFKLGIFLLDFQIKKYQISINDLFLTLKISMQHGLYFSLWQCRSIALDHVKPSLVHECFRIQSIGMVPLQ